MRYLIIIILLSLLGGCHWYDPEEIEEGIDPRLVEMAHKVCKDHNGVLRYWIESKISNSVRCFDRTLFDLHTGEEIK